MGRALSTLYLTQLLFGLLVFFTLDWIWVSRVLPLAYLFTMFLILRALSEEGFSRRQGLALALLWQAPGLLGSLANLITELGLYMRIDILDFVMQTWHLPLLPWVAAAPNIQWRDGALYYWLLSILSPLVVLLFPLPLGQARVRSVQLSSFLPGSLSPRGRTRGY